MLFVIALFTVLVVGLIVWLVRRKGESSGDIYYPGGLTGYS